MFARKGVPYQAAVTKIRFDPEAASPRLLFKFERFLDADDAATVRDMIDSAVVSNIVGDGPVSVPDVEATPAVKPAKIAAKVAEPEEGEAEEEAPVTKKGTTVPKRVRLRSLPLVAHLMSLLHLRKNPHPKQLKPRLLRMTMIWQQH